MFEWSWVIFAKKSKFHDAGGPDTMVSPTIRPHCHYDVYLCILVSGHLCCHKTHCTTASWAPLHAGQHSAHGPLPTALLVSGSPSGTTTQERLSSCPSYIAPSHTIHTKVQSDACFGCIYWHWNNVRYDMLTCWLSRYCDQWCQALTI